MKLAETPDGKLVAIKRFKGDVVNIQSLRHELSILRKLHHENLVNLIDVRENATYKKKSGPMYTLLSFSYQCFAIVLEYVGGGELFDFIALGGRFTPNVARTYFQQMLNGLHYMHQQGFAHRDIKPENILLTSDFILKLADFGFTGALEGKDKSGRMHTKLGTEGYMAPEIQSKDYVGTCVDIFSAGVILFIMYTGTPPFEKTTPNDSYYRLIKERNYTTFWNAHSKRKPVDFYTEDFKDLVNRMLEYNPADRITLVQIAQHPWAKGQVLTQGQLQEEFLRRKKKIDDERQKAEIEKERMKAMRANACNNEIYSAQNRTAYGAFDREGELEPGIKLFLQELDSEEGKVRELKLQRTVRKEDFVVDSTETEFFSALKAFLSAPIVLKVEEDSIEFTPEYEDKNDEVPISLTQIIASFEYDAGGL